MPAAATGTRLRIKTRTKLQVRSHSRKLEHAQKADKLRRKVDRFYKHLKKLSEVALRDFQGTEEPSGELELDQNLQKKLAQVLSPFTKDGRIVLTRELAVLGAYRILRMGSGEEGQQMHEPKTIPIPSLRPEMKPEPEPRYWVEEAVVDVEAQEEWRGNEAEAHSQCGPASSPNSCIY